MTPTRVVIVNDASRPIGGASSLAMTLACELRQRGVAVSFVAGDSGDGEQLLDAGVDVWALGQRRMGEQRFAPPLLAGLHNRAAQSLIEKAVAKLDSPTTVYHVHGWAQILSPAVFAGLRQVMGRTVVHAHDFFMACPNGAYGNLRTGDVCNVDPLSVRCLTTSCDRRSAAHKTWRLARTAVLKHHVQHPGPRRLLLIHSAMREAMVRAGYRPAQLAVVPNPVTVHTDSRVQAENNHGFLYLGRLEETKGPDLACAAARAAGVPLLLAGTGALMDPLRAQYPEFEFLGAIPRSDVPQVMQRARCLLMPSRYPEPYGMVATEALWSGVPVICSDTALLANQIEAIEAGFGCPPRDVVRFSALLRELARDDLLVRRMSLNAVSRSREMGLTLSRWLDACQFQYTQCLTPDPQNATARDVAPEQAAS